MIFCNEMETRLNPDSFPYEVLGGEGELQPSWDE